jgi:hypothetical protein
MHLFTWPQVEQIFRELDGCMVAAKVRYKMAQEM